MSSKSSDKLVSRFANPILCLTHTNKSLVQILVLFDPNLGFREMGKLTSDNETFADFARNAGSTQFQAGLAALPTHHLRRTPFSHASADENLQRERRGRNPGYAEKQPGVSPVPGIRVGPYVAADFP